GGTRPTADREIAGYGRYGGGESCTHECLFAPVGRPAGRVCVTRGRAVISARRRDLRAISTDQADDSNEGATHRRWRCARVAREAGAVEAADEQFRERDQVGRTPVPRGSELLRWARAVGVWKLPQERPTAVWPNGS